MTPRLPTTETAAAAGDRTTTFRSSRLAQVELRIFEERPWPAHAGLPTIVETLAQWGLNRQPQECMWVVANDSMTARTVIEVGRGNMQAVDLHIPSMIAAVVTSGTDRFTLVHNHPSNDPRPSPNDIELTLMVLEAANICGLTLEDHIIVTPGGAYQSLVEMGVFLPAPIETVPAVDVNA